MVWFFALVGAAIFAIAKIGTGDEEIARIATGDKEGRFYWGSLLGSFPLHIISLTATYGASRILTVITPSWPHTWRQLKFLAARQTWKKPYQTTWLSFGILEILYASRFWFSMYVLYILKQREFFSSSYYTFFEEDNSRSSFVVLVSKMFTTNHEFKNVGTRKMNRNLFRLLFVFQGSIPLCGGSWKASIQKRTSLSSGTRTLGSYVYQVSENIRFFWSFHHNPTSSSQKRLPPSNVVWSLLSRDLLAWTASTCTLLLQDQPRSRQNPWRYLP